MRPLLFLVSSFAAGAVFLSGCAMPVPEGSELGAFISAKEVEIVELIRQGMDSYNRGRYLEAELLFRQALYVNNDLPKVKVNLAAALERQGQYAEAGAIYQDLLSQDPDSVLYLSGLAHLKVTETKFEEARALYEKALALAVEQDQRKAEKAKESEENQLKAPGNPPVPPPAPPAAAFGVARSLSVLSFRVGDVDNALCWSESALDMLPQVSKEEFLKYVKVLVSAGKLNEAERKLRRFASKEGIEKEASILHELAIINFGRRDYKVAYEFERIGLVPEPSDPQLNFEMKLVKYLCEEKLNIEHDTYGQSTEAQELFEQQMSQLRDRGSSAMLYWPVTLIEAVLERKAE